MISYLILGEIRHDISCGSSAPVPIAKWLKHPLRELVVEGSNPSVSGSGVPSDMAGW